MYLTEAEIGDLLTMADVVETLEEMFRARARGEIVNRPRVRVPITAGTYNVMPAGWIERGVVGHKTYTASAKGASFQIVLYAADGSGLLAVMGGGRISGLRTGRRPGSRPGSSAARRRRAGRGHRRRVPGDRCRSTASSLQPERPTSGSARSIRGQARGRSRRAWRSRPGSTSMPRAIRR